MKPIPYSEAQKRATKKYMEKYMSRVVVSFNRKTEPELTAYIESCDNKSGTLKAALREKMERERTDRKGWSLIPYSESQKRATMKYKREHVRRFAVEFNRETESDAISYIENSANKQATIKRAIYSQMEREK